MADGIPSDIESLWGALLGTSLPGTSLLGTSLLEGSVSGDIDAVPMALACLLLVVAAVAANAGSALLVYSPSKLQKMADPDAAPELLAYLDRNEVEILILSRLLMIAAAVGGFVLSGRSVDGSLGQVVVVSYAVAMMFLIAAIPAAVASRIPERTVLLSLPLLRPLRSILSYPVIKPLAILCRPVLRALKIPNEPPSDPDEIADEIMAAVADTDRGELAEEEKTWIGNIVELKELHTSEVMTPRTDIVALEAGVPLLEAIRTAAEKGHSRLPVYQETIDNVVGVFYAKDILGRIADGQESSAIKVGELTRDPLFAPESMRVSDLLREFRTSKVQMAIVIDEYGGTAGLITIEDVLEEIIGEIEDEFDPDAEAPITVITEGVIEVSGKTRVEEANAALSEPLVPEGEDYDTVGGFVFSYLGQIPSVDETFEVAGLQYKILSVENRRIGRLRLTGLTAQPSDT